MIFIDLDIQLLFYIKTLNLSSLIIAKYFNFSAYYVIITRACYNMMLSQVLLRICTRSLSKRQREIMTGQIAPSYRGNGGAGGNLLFYLRKIIAYVETTHLFDDEVEDVPFQGIKVSKSMDLVIWISLFSNLFGYIEIQLLFSITLGSYLSKER